MVEDDSLFCPAVNQSAALVEERSFIRSLKCLLEFRIMESMYRTSATQCCRVVFSVLCSDRRIPGTKTGCRVGIKGLVCAGVSFYRAHNAL